MNILDKIVAKTQIRVDLAKSQMPLGKVIALANNVTLEPFRFEKSLATSDMSFICEAKKASPSKGVIAEIFPYVEIAKDYQQGGASAISVLTEPDFFLGNDKYLSEISQNVQIPLLRKDFTIDEYQIYEAKALGASAVLLICAILSEEQIKEFIHIADSLGLSCLVEAHDEIEIQKAINAKARIIGVNNRNLKTFDVNINNSIALRKLVPSDILFVSESGIKDFNDIKILQDNNVNAVLVGETLMRADDRVKALKTLRGK